MEVTKEEEKIVPEDLAQVLDKVLSKGWREAFSLSSLPLFRGKGFISFWGKIEEGHYLSPNFLRFDYPEILTFQVWSDGTFSMLISLGDS